MPWNVLGFRAYDTSDGCYYYLSNMSCFLKKKKNEINPNLFVYPI